MHEISRIRPLRESKIKFFCRPTMVGDMGFRHVTHFKSKKLAALFLAEMYNMSLLLDVILIYLLNLRG